MIADTDEGAEGKDQESPEAAEETSLEFEVLSEEDSAAQDVQEGPDGPLAILSEEEPDLERAAGSGEDDD